jgi:hypothetical protein
MSPLSAPSPPTFRRLAADAAELDMAVITLALWCMRQKGPPYVKVGRKILYSRTTVKEWIASQVRKPLQGTRRAGKGGQ